jgi:flavodoxin
MSLKDMAKQTTGGLAFDVVATRDIRPGEEVFIDYGVEWEQAWKKHVQNWKPPQESEQDSWITAKEANDRKEDILDEFVTDDLRKTTNHSYLFTGCQYWPSDEDENDVYHQYEEWKSWDDDKILKTYSFNGAGDSMYYSDYSRHYDHAFWPCSILEKTKKSYTVRIHQSEFNDEQPWSYNNVPRILTDYPREAIHYFVKPRMSDQRLKGVFRHSIGIPDIMFPGHWKNLRKKSTNDTLSGGPEAETISH